MSEPLPFAKFRVYPDRKRHFYFTVYVFANIKEMYKFADAQRRDGPASRSWKKKRAAGYSALTMSWERWSFKLGKMTGTLNRDIGTIIFHRQRTGTGIVSHEMTHAAVRYLQTIRKPPNCDPKREELLAETVGHLTRQFYVRY